MSKERVMIVDDDKEFLIELEETLRLGGYDPVAVQDSSTVLETVREFRPDIILLDLKMNKVSGFQVAINLRQAPDTSDIPIIAMTGYFTGDHHLPLLNVCGVLKCISKPFKPQNIISEIETMIKNRAA
ncbi:MAG: response regulator [Candidatus Omnitrophota bacterium]|nr:response regulator [Candidatus Omnitrophota bacterium]